MPLDDIEKAVDEVASPERLTRWIVRIVLLFVLVGVGISVAKLCFHFVGKVDAVTTDRAWFASQQEAIQAAKLEEQAAREALERHNAEVKERSGFLSISHKDDRDKADAFNRTILSAQTRRLSLIKDYNARAAEVSDPAFLEGLPKRIELE